MRKALTQQERDRDEYTKSQKEWVRNAKIKVGSTVLVLDKAEEGQGGWPENWVSPEMDSFVGNEVEVTYIDWLGIHLQYEGDGYYFPFFVLATVDEESNGTK